MHRFFLNPDQIKGDTVLFPADISHQIVRVLRMASQEHLIVLDDLGNEFFIELLKLDPVACQGKIVRVRQPDLEPNTKIFLFVGLTQREKFEWILQKGTEVGVSQFIPVVNTRSLVQKNEQWDKKVTRILRVIREAAEQAGRVRLPSLVPPMKFSEAIGYACSSVDMGIIPWENEIHTGLKDFFRNTSPDVSNQRVAIFVGPEGGYTDEEIHQAIEAGMIPVSLGRRILRMETAAIVATSLVLYELGDLGGGRIVSS
jgi:16S rRNA (uracil1498-N3)-methyltransferase